MCFNARANARSTSLRALARALFGMSLTLISESVREELDVLLRKCRGSRPLDSRRSDRTVPDDRAAVRRLTDWRFRGNDRCLRYARNDGAQGGIG